jgi:FkbM family methyltransferase
MFRARSFGQEEEFLQCVINAISPGDVFFDIGSSIGLYAIHAAMLNAKVVAFEPDPYYRKRLLKNIKINKQEKSIRVIDWAVSDHEGTVVLYTDGVDGNSPSLVMDGKRQTVCVPTMSIDNAIHTGEIPYPTIIKMDIEGAEMKALLGMNRLLASKVAPRMLFIEFHPEMLNELGSTIDECIRYVESFRYQKTWMQNRAMEIHYIFKKY